MDFSHYNFTHYKGLKIMLRYRFDDSSVYFIFEESFNPKKDKNVRPFIVGVINTYPKHKIINFQIEDNFWEDGRLPNYQGRGYGTIILHYIEDCLIPTFGNNEDWTIKISGSEDEYNSFKNHYLQKKKEYNPLSLKSNNYKKVLTQNKK